jgi:myo-inositol-1(or 4)-monophosphatase
MRNDALLAVAIEAATAGAAFVRQHAPDAARLEWSEKATSDFVTDVDRGAEAIIASVVSRHMPHALLIGEELSPTAVAGDTVAFVVDPLDGTTNFLHAYPEYAVSIGVTCAGELLAAVVLNVPTGESFTASRGAGAFRNGQPVTVSSTQEPGRALVGTGFPFKHRSFIPRYLGQLERVIASTAGVRRAGSAALDLAAVACGRFDAFWELMLAPWDVAAGILLVREAGGCVTNLQGVDSTVDHAPIVAGNPAMHAWLLRALDPASTTARPPRAPNM